MEMIDYLKTQLHRMNSEQRSLVARIAAMPADAKLIKSESEALTTIYMWLHMKPGSIEKRKL